jgi:putative exosortase-associated protein (TIGR04073 family)
MSRAFLPLLLMVGLVAGACLAAETEPPAAEAEKPVGMGPLSRLCRGVTNILICPLEIPATMQRVTEEQNVAFGIVGGGAEGVGNGVVRFFAGCAEILCAPLPFRFPPLYSKRLGQRALSPERPPTGVTPL